MSELDEKTNPFIIGRTHREIASHLKKNGWSLARERGDHEIYTHPKSTNHIAVPKHKGDIAPGTVRDIMKKTQITEQKTETKSSDPNKSSSRFDASDSLVDIYKKQTPGQSSLLKTIKRVVKEDKNGYKNPTGGLTQKGRDHYNRESGGHLQAPVTTPPSKLKAGSKPANRRKSFCARMSGVKGPMKKPNGEPTRKALALRKWNC